MFYKKKKKKKKRKKVIGDEIFEEAPVVFVCHVCNYEITSKGENN